jgi:cysteinyl-tRNA synthetase
MQATLPSLQNALSGYQRLREFINRVHLAQSTSEDPRVLPEKLFALEQRFFDALSDDLNTPRALAILFQFIRQANPILDRGEFNEAQRQQILDTFGKLNKVLGVFDLDLQALTLEEESILRRREDARKGKDWKEADRLRDDLHERGIRVIDTPQGSRWERIITPSGS